MCPSSLLFLLSLHVVSGKKKLSCCEDDEKNKKGLNCARLPISKRILEWVKFYEMKLLQHFQIVQWRTWEKTLSSLVAHSFYCQAIFGKLYDLYHARYLLMKENRCFSHWQLYVVCLCVGKSSDFFVNAPEGKSRNNVYPQVLEWIKTIERKIEISFISIILIQI